MIEIRKAEMNDAERLLQIYDFYVKNTAITFEYETPSLEAFKTRMVNTMSRYPFLVTEKDERIEGYAYAGVFKDRATYDWSCETTIYIDRDQRKSGLGRMLYEALEKELKEMGIREPDEEHLIRMEKKRELWDLYDREGRRTGEIFERGFGTYGNIPQGRFHLVSDILVRNKDGRYLLCKRHMGKDVYPGFWEASAGGSAKVGELPEVCARRELKEETGLEADQLELINVVFREPSHSLIYCYVADVDADPDSVILQEGETVDYKWVDAAGLIEYSTSDVAIKTNVERYSNFYNVLKLEAQNIHVRRAVQKDVPEIEVLFIEMLRTIYKRDEVTGYEEGYLDRFFSGSLDFIYVAEAEGEVIAFLSVEEHNENERYIYLDDLSVTEKFRNRGVGKGLMGMAEMYSVKEGIPAILLHVDQRNESAYNLYARLGYSEIADDGDRMLMKKDFFV